MTSSVKIVLYGATPKMIHLNIQIWANFQKSPTKFGKNCKGRGAVFLALLVYHPNHDYVTIWKPFGSKQVIARYLVLVDPFVLDPNWVWLILVKLKRSGYHEINQKSEVQTLNEASKYIYFHIFTCQLPKCKQIDQPLWVYFTAMLKWDAHGMAIIQE